MTDIIGAVNGFSHACTALLWRASWQGAIAVALIWTACRAWLRMPPRVRVWLWRLVFLKFLVALISIRPVALPVLPAAVISSSIEPRAAPLAFVPAPIGDLPPVAPESGADVMLPTASSILLCLWVVGCLLCLWRLALSWQAARRLRLQSQPVVDPTVAGLLGDLCRLSGLRRPPTLVTSKTVGPLLVGVWQPVVVLPERLLRRSSQREACLMLAHEVAHVKHRDLWWNWLALTVQALFFFHPLVWLGRREWVVSQEMACDALALQLTSSSEVEYSEMLIRAAARGRGARDEVVALGIAESFRSLSQRVAAIAQLTSVSRRRLLMIATSIVMLGALSLVPWRLAARGGINEGGAQAAVPERGDSMTTYPRSAMLEDVPPGRPDCNSYARGLETALNYVGTPVDADTIMGDTGMAFILMSEEGGPLIDGAVDVGWWPLASWGIEMRLDFLAQAVGREVRLVPADAAGYRADPAATYRNRFEGEVKASIATGRPVLAVHDVCFVVYGYDENEPPLLGNWAPESEKTTVRIERYPWSLIVLGDEISRLDRKAADLAALRHAVALGRDELDIRLPAYWAEWTLVTAGYTGQKSFALWAETLRDTEHLGQRRWHAHMRLHLGINRRSAVRYLRAMAERYPDNVAAHLRAAADLYEEVLAQLETAEITEAAMMSAQGREKLAQLVESMARIEAKAIAEIERALAAAGG